jgi:Rrf2 family nitric oxide-sensitive transcriptional repressor
MRLTTRTNLAMRALMFCAVNAGRTVRKSDIATACNVSENHLAQVIHLLGVKGFLQTQRGRTGGLKLARPAPEISVGEVFRTLESDVPFIECFTGGESNCPLHSFCRLTCVLKDAVEAFYAKLDEVTLADLVVDNCDLNSLLQMAPGRRRVPSVQAA